MGVGNQNQVHFLGLDHYPFGSQMPGRNSAEGSYRYGFQGQEKDDEVKGSGNSINYKYRMHDPRIGRFFGVDPLVHKYPWNSPYAFSENRVIDGVELEGLEYAPTKDKQGNVTGADFVGYNDDGTPKEGSVPVVAWNEEKEINGSKAMCLTYTDCIEGYGTTSIPANSSGMVKLPHTSTYNQAGNSLPAGDLTIGDYTVYNIYNYEGNDQYGSPNVVADMINIAVAYQGITGGLLNYGDMSRPTGATFKPHKSHNGGTQFDFRYAVGSPDGSRRAATYYIHSEKNILNLQTFIDVAYENGMRNFILPAETMGKIINPANGKSVDQNYSPRSGKTFDGVHFLFGAGHEDHGHAGR